MAEESNTEFVYTEGVVVPHDVVRVRVHPSVTVIPHGKFQNCTQLKEVELCDGLLEIGGSAFAFTSIKRINIPSTVKTIGRCAFAWIGLNTLHLPDGISNIGEYTFCSGRFPTFRIPPLVTTIPERMCSTCEGMFSIELPMSITLISASAFGACKSLRNIVLPIDAVVGFRGNKVFNNCHDLQQLFIGTTGVDENPEEQNIINALQHRFDNLPIHKMIYYQSYNNFTVEQLKEATNMRSNQSRSLRSKLDPTGSQQDCLGMTPLHILACSTVQNIELYKVLVEKYPESLLTEDRWGAKPLLYAIWGNAPNEIIQFLVESYKSLYPNYEFGWTLMVETLGKVNKVPLIQSRICLIFNKNSSLCKQLIGILFLISC